MPSWQNLATCPTDTVTSESNCYSHKNVLVILKAFLLSKIICLSKKKKRIKKSRHGVCISKLHGFPSIKDKLKYFSLYKITCMVWNKRRSRRGQMEFWRHLSVRIRLWCDWRNLKSWFMLCSSLHVADIYQTCDISFHEY